jgi:dipeptidyl-peptidase-4
MINILKILFPGNSKAHLVLFLIGLIITPVFIEAQEKSQDVLTLERIYKRNEFRLNRFGPVRWLEDGSGYTILEKSQDIANAQSIIKYNPKTGERSVLVRASQLIPEGKKNPLPI